MILPILKNVMKVLVYTLTILIVFILFVPSAFAVQIITGSAHATPSTIPRFDNNTTDITVDFSDIANLPVNDYSITIKLRPDYVIPITTVTENGKNDLSNISITNTGGTNYNASVTWDPPDNQLISSYDIFISISNGIVSDTDSFDNNLNEIYVTSANENSAPVVQHDRTTVSPAGIERIGINQATFTAPFYDFNATSINDFLVTFKLRHPDNIAEILLADNAAHGSQNVTIIDNSGGNYLATINWDPPDNQELGFYDLYFHVSDGIDTSYDFFANNLDELQIYDAISNNPPSLIAGNTKVIPASVNRNGSDFTMIKSSFSDVDMPGKGAFMVTILLRDPDNLNEITIVNSAKNGEQGLRIFHSGGSNYEASVLWDPSVLNNVGNYDLFFSVTDNNGTTVTDNYISNLDELQIISSVIAGDGHLLHRTNNSDNCGGVNSACHNLENHNINDCLTCHTPHNTKNIYLIKDTIQTPNSGNREVIFKTLGINDPYNDPDPIVGDPNSGVMADDQDGVTTGVCEVCHTSTKYHQNDGTSPLPGHNNATNCIDCHSHQSGFSGGESSGGASCSCHQNIFTAMDSTSIAHRHILANMDANYSPGISGMYTIKNCLTCHVDHDIFRPDLNTGIGQRGKNLRVDWATDPIQGDSTVLSNSDYSNSGEGGICLSCHTGSSCNNCHSAHKISLPPIETAAAVPTAHVFIPKADYDAASSTHNYNVPSTFSTDGSVFNANCTKCHNDTMEKSYQNSSTKISLHASDYPLLLDTTGIATPQNPLEEQFCFKCHSTTSNPNSGSNQDIYGIKGMGTPSLAIESEFARTYVHPVNMFNGIHSPGEDITSMTRHVECADCHNPHAASAGGAGLPNSLKGVSGIDTSGAKINPVNHSYEICFKCHGDQNSGTPVIVRDDGSTNTRLEFSPNALSYHPVTAVGKNPNSPSLINGWTETSIMTCEDCHSSSGASSTPGPHGSQYSTILRLQYDTGDNLVESATRYALCYDCHNRSSILNDDSWKEHSKHIVGEDAPCSICHDPHGLSSVGAGSGAHLISFDLNVVSPSGTRIEFLDSGNNTPTCWLTCHGKDHDGWN